MGVLYVTPGALGDPAVGGKKYEDERVGLERCNQKNETNVIVLQFVIIRKRYLWPEGSRGEILRTSQLRI